MTGFAQSLSGPATRAKHQVLDFLDRYPVLFEMQMRIRRSRHLAVTPETEIVIEGFPRSANTRAVAAFEIAQGRAVRIARHLHSPAHVLRALDLGVPTLVVVRRLPDPVLSLLIREPALRLDRVLARYERFHRLIAARADEFVVAPFEEVVNDYPAVIRRVNAKYGTAFCDFVASEDVEKRVQARIEAMELEDSGVVGVREASVARPSAGRDREKARIRTEYERECYSSLRLAAERAADHLLLSCGGA